MAFTGQTRAGQELAGRLEHLRAARPIVLALPPGGDPIALEIARILEAPLHPLEVRPLYMPDWPDVLVGAIAEGTGTSFDEGALGSLGLYPDDLLEVVRAERAELRRAVSRYRDVRRLTDLSGRTVILVDDGVDSGLTMLAAIASVRGRHCDQVVVAVATGPSDALDRLREEADQVIALEELGASAGRPEGEEDLRV
jgi:putative phosphoribosyl transferase